jgi:hypothetical protein
MYFWTQYEYDIVSYKIWRNGAWCSLNGYSNGYADGSPAAVVYNGNVYVFWIDATTHKLTYDFMENPDDSVCPTSQLAWQSGGYPYTIDNQSNFAQQTLVGDVSATVHNEVLEVAVIDDNGDKWVTSCNSEEGTCLPLIGEIGEPIRGWTLLVRQPNPVAAGAPSLYHRDSNEFMYMHFPEESTCTMKYFAKKGW